MEQIVKEQILKVRATGETNMLDANMVQRIANREEFYELVCFIEDNRRAYSHFILTGELPEEESK